MRKGGENNIFSYQLPVVLSVLIPVQSLAGHEEQSLFQTLQTAWDTLHVMSVHTHTHTHTHTHMHTHARTHAHTRTHTRTHTHTRTRTRTRTHTHTHTHTRTRTRTRTHTHIITTFMRTGTGGIFISKGNLGYFICD